MLGFRRKRKLESNSKELKDKDADPTTAIKNKIDEISNRITNNQASEEEIEWLKNIYRIVIIKKHLPGSNHGPWPGSYAIIAFVCVVIGGLLLFFRIGDIPIFDFLATNNVSIQVRCKALQVSITDSERSNILGFNELVSTDYFEMTRLNTVTVSEGRLSFFDSLGNINAKLRADTIFLDAIELGMASILEIRQFQDIIQITTQGSPVKVSASFNGAEFLEPVTKEVHSKQDFDIPLFARFESMNNDSTELEIKFRHKQPVNILEGKKINSLSFIDSYVYGADILKYISTIQSGTLTLSDVNRSIDLHKQDRLVLQNLEGWLIDFAVQNDTINLFFKGTVRDIKAGPDGSEKDLSPTLLEYLFKNQPLTLFWGAVVFLWGLLSSISSRFKLS